MKKSGSISFGRYSRILIFLVVSLALVSITLGWLFFRVHAWITFANVLLLWAILLVLILYQVRKVNRDLARFFHFIVSGESTEGFNLTKSDPIFRDLHRQMNDIVKNLGTVRMEKERDFLFFKAIFDNADIGLLAYDEAGNITLINQSARLLLGITGRESSNLIFGKSAESLVKEIKSGKNEILKHTRNGEMVQLSVRSQSLRISGKEITLLSVQNIRQELEQHEIESWQKLIRVFIHEIMNSVSPITLTASGIIGLLEKGNNNQRDKNQQSDILEGLRAIRKRSKGISAFMESYRQLSKTPVPEFKWVQAGKLAESVGQLIQKEFQEKNINFSVNLSQKEIKVWCDERLVEHVIINLIKNAVEALGDTINPEIKLSCVSLLNTKEIMVQDNGPGIPPEILESIFVPFFTTKTEGTGIGLSLSRQIMNLHGGSIFVNSKKGETIFTLSFPVVNI